MEGLSVAIRKVSNREFDGQEIMKRILILQSSLCEKKEAIKSMSFEELQRLCSSYLKLAGLYKGIGSYKNAENCYLDAIAIKRKLSVKGSSRAEVCLAAIYEGLGDIYVAQGKEDKALIAYLSEVKVYEKLYKGNTDAYENLLGDKYFLLGKRYKARKLHKEAENLLIKAESIFLKRITKTSDKDIIRRLIELHDILGDHYFQGKDFKKAEKEYFNSLDLRQELSEYNYMDYFSDMGISFYNLARLYRAWGKCEEAESYIKRARYIESEIF